MPKRKKLKLENLKVQSFVTLTNADAGELRAGGTWTICKTCGSECGTQCGCTWTICRTCGDECETLLTRPDC